MHTTQPVELQPRGADARERKDRLLRKDRHELLAHAPRDREVTQRMAAIEEPHICQLLVKPVVLNLVAVDEVAQGLLQRLCPHLLRFEMQGARSFCSLSVLPSPVPDWRATVKDVCLGDVALVSVREAAPAFDPIGLKL